MGCLAGYRREERKVGMKRRRRRKQRGEFAVVAHDIICFVEGGSQGHSKRRGGKD